MLIRWGMWKDHRWAITVQGGASDWRDLDFGFVFGFNRKGCVRRFPKKRGIVGDPLSAHHAPLEERRCSPFWVWTDFCFSMQKRRRKRRPSLGKLQSGRVKFRSRSVRFALQKQRWRRQWCQWSNDLTEIDDGSYFGNILTIWSPIWDLVAPTDSLLADLHSYGRRLVVQRLMEKFEQSKGIDLFVWYRSHLGSNFRSVWSCIVKLQCKILVSLLYGMIDQSQLSCFRTHTH